MHRWVRVEKGNQTRQCLARYADGVLLRCGTVVCVWQRSTVLLHSSVLALPWFALLYFALSCFALLHHFAPCSTPLDADGMPIDRLRETGQLGRVRLCEKILILYQAPLLCSYNMRMAPASPEPHASKTSCTIEELVRTSDQQHVVLPSTSSN